MLHHDLEINARLIFFKKQRALFLKELRIVQDENIEILQRKAAMVILCDSAKAIHHIVNDIADCDVRFPEGLPAIPYNLSELSDLNHVSEVIDVAYEEIAKTQNK
jgi:hypothetical protein